MERSNTVQPAPEERGARQQDDGGNAKQKKRKKANDKLSPWPMYQTNNDFIHAVSPMERKTNVRTRRTQGHE